MRDAFESHNTRGDQQLPRRASLVHVITTTALKSLTQSMKQSPSDPKYFNQPQVTIAKRCVSINQSRPSTSTPARIIVIYLEYIQNETMQLFYLLCAAAN